MSTEVVPVAPAAPVVHSQSADVNGQALTVTSDMTPEQRYNAFARAFGASEVKAPQSALARPSPVTRVPGAPFAFTPPDGLEADMTHPLVKGFTEWATARDLPPKDYQYLLGELCRYEAAQIPDFDAIKEWIGPDADARIDAVGAWVRSSLGDQANGMLRLALRQINAGSVFWILEHLMQRHTQ